MTLFWTPAREAQLFALVSQRLTAEQIGERIGCTRKAVTTKVKRGGGRFGTLDRANRPNAGANRFWTPERERALVELVARRLSAQQIAAEIGCTRHAVVGKVWRAKGGLGKLAREPGENGRSTRPPRRAPRPHPRPSTAAPAPSPARRAATRPATEPVAFLDAVERGLCLWFACEAYDHSGPAMPVCGASRDDVPGTRYCAHHAGRAGRRDEP